MGLLGFIRTSFAATQYNLLNEELAEYKAKGADDCQAAMTLIVRKWELLKPNHLYHLWPDQEEIAARAHLLATNLGQMAVPFLLFCKKVGVEKAVKQMLVLDPFFKRYGSLYGPAVPLANLAREPTDRLWQHESIAPSEIIDPAFAAYYATLAAPCAIDAWIMLAQLKLMGYCPKIDTRDHVAEGRYYAERFIEKAQSTSPEFCADLKAGIEILNALETV
jgi:hypothetical protein